VRAIDIIWNERKLYEPENTEHIEEFVREFSDIDFYIETMNRAGFRYIHKIGDDETKTDIDKELMMVENQDAIMFYSTTTRSQSSHWIIKRKPGCYEVCKSSYKWMGVMIFEDRQDAINDAITRISGGDDEL